MRITSVGAELFHADRYDQVNCHFSQLCKHAIVLRGGRKKSIPA